MPLLCSSPTRENGAEQRRGTILLGPSTGVVIGRNERRAPRPEESNLIARGFCRNRVHHRNGFCQASFKDFRSACTMGASSASLILSAPESATRPMRLQATPLAVGPALDMICSNGSAFSGRTSTRKRVLDSLKRRTGVAVASLAQGTEPTSISAQIGRAHV